MTSAVIASTVELKLILDQVETETGVGRQSYSRLTFKPPKPLERRVAQHPEHVQPFWR